MVVGVAQVHGLSSESRWTQALAVACPAAKAVAARIDS